MKSALHSVNWWRNGCNCTFTNKVYGRNEDVEFVFVSELKLTNGSVEVSPRIDGLSSCINLRSSRTGKPSCIFNWSIGRPIILFIHWLNGYLQIHYQDDHIISLHNKGILVIINDHFIIIFVRKDSDELFFLFTVHP